MIRLQRHEKGWPALSEGRYAALNHSHGLG
jgi:hypothetical protein